MDRAITASWQGQSVATRFRTTRRSLDRAELAIATTYHELLEKFPRAAKVPFTR